MPESQPQMRAISELADTNPEALGVGTDPRAHFKYIDLSSVSSGTVAWNSAPEVTLLTAPSRARRVLRHGDVLFGTVRPNLQSHGFVDWTGSSALVGSTGFSVIRPKAGVGDPRYLFHCVMSGGIAVQANRDAVGSSYPALNDSDVRRFQVFAPPVGEQEAIAQILDTLDATLRQTEAVIEKLKQVKQGLLHDLLTRGIDANGELRPPYRQAPHLYKDSPLGWIPVDWQVELLDDVAFRGSGHTPSKSVASYWNGGVRWVSLADSNRLDQIYIDRTDKEISDFGIANSSAVKHSAGTVILSRDAGVGKSAVLASEMAVSQHFMAWHCTDRLANLYLYFKLQHMKPAFEAIALGSTVKTIGLDYFRKLRVPVPARSEQDTSVEIMLVAESNVRRYESDLGKLRLLKSGLMDDLLTGRVRVTPLLVPAAP